MFNQALFAKKLSGLTPYTVDTGRYTLRLDANESCFALPDELVEVFAEKLNTLDFNRYPDPSAEELCASFAAYYGIQRENVCAGNGSDEILSILMNGFVDKGRAVMTFAPDFSMYAFYASLAELRVVDLPKRANDLQIDFTAAEERIKKEQVKLCVFSNPCNPTGRIERKSDIVALANACPETLFVVDEAYMDFAGEKRTTESFLQDVTAYPNIIVLKTLSKALGAAALRLGFVVADESFCRMFNAVKSPYNVNSVSQSFGCAVLQRPGLLRERTAYITRAAASLRTALVETGLAEMPPLYTNFVYFRTPRGAEIFEYLKKNGVLVRHFASQSALRITTGSLSQNEMLISLLTQSPFAGKI